MIVNLSSDCEIERIFFLMRILLIHDILVFEKVCGGIVKCNYLWCMYFFVHGNFSKISRVISTFSKQDTLLDPLIDAPIDYSL